MPLAGLSCAVECAELLLRIAAQSNLTSARNISECLAVTSVVCDSGVACMLSLLPYSLKLHEVVTYATFRPTTGKDYCCPLCDGFHCKTGAELLAHQTREHGETDEDDLKDEIGGVPGSAVGTGDADVGSHFMYVFDVPSPAC